MRRFFGILFFSIIGFQLFGTTLSEKLKSSMVWTNGTGHTAVFRKTFDLPIQNDPASVVIFADSYYALYVNGEYVVSGPGRFDPKWPEYDSIDVTTLLHQGENTLAVLVYGGISNGMRMKHVPCLAMVLTGDSFSITTDDTWKCSENTRFKQPLSKWNGIRETIDATTQVGDCLLPAYNDSAWEAARFIDGAQWGIIHPRSIPMLSQNEIQPKELSLPINIDQILTLQFDRNYLLTAELEFDSPDSCEVTIGGTSYIGNKGSHKFRTYDPFGITDAALAIKTTKPITLKKIRFFNPVYPFELKGSFSCSDTSLNRLWGMSLHTLQQVSEDGYQDCPWERAEWMGDAGIIEYPLTRVAFVSDDGVLSDPRLIRKMIRDIAQSADSTGRIKAHHPSDRFDIHAYIEDYSCIWVQSLREYYEFTYDTAFVREMWPVLTNLMDWFIAQKAESGLINAREFIIFDNPLKYKVCEGATINAFTYKAFKDAAFLSEMIGDSANGAYFSNSATDLRKAFNTVLWNDSLNLFNASTVDKPNYHSALLPLDRGIVDDNKKPFVEKWLLENIDKASKALMTYTHFWLFEFLYSKDKDEWDNKAIEIMRGRYSRFYAPENIGYTVAEGFGGKRPFHNFGSSAAYFMSANILGVKVQLPVASNVLIIKPQLGSLTKAEGTVVTEHGLVDVKWEKPSGESGLKFEFSVPQGKTGLVYLPVSVSDKKLVVNGKKQKFKRKGRYALLEFKGGKYQGEIYNK
jgi:alpha-L-rhamnosidase